MKINLLKVFKNFIMGAIPPAILTIVGDYSHVEVIVIGLFMAGLNLVEWIANNYFKERE